MICVGGLKTRSGKSPKSQYYRDAIVFPRLRFQNVFRPHENEKPHFSNSSGFKSIFEKLRFRDGLVWAVGLTFEIKLRFRDGLVWTVGLTVEIKLRFRDGLVWTVGLTVEIKLRFRDELVWTVGLTVEIKLRFRDGLVWTVGLTVEIKLRFRDGLVWTVGLTKLRFQISPAKCADAALCLPYDKTNQVNVCALFYFRKSEEVLN